MQEVGKVQEKDLDNYGLPGEAADEPPAGVSAPECPDTGLKQVFGVELSPEDKTTYSTSDSFVKPQVLRPRSPVRARVFPPKKEPRGYKDYYPERPEVQYSPIGPRAEARPDPFVTQRRGMPEPKHRRATSTSAPQHEQVPRREQSTLDTLQDTVKTTVGSLVEALSRLQSSCGYNLSKCQSTRLVLIGGYSMQNSDRP